MRDILLFPLFLFCGYAWAQIQIIDNRNSKPIPYAAILDSNSNLIGSTDQNGILNKNILSNDSIIFIDAFGYKTASFRVKDLDTPIRLAPEILLKALELHPAQGKNIRTIHKLKRKKRHWYGGGSGIGTYKIGRSFGYKRDYDKTPFIYELKLYTKSHVKNAVFSVMLYNLDSTGLPQDPLHSKPIIVKAKKGKSYCKIPLVKKSIKFPKSGLAIILQNHYTERNKRTFEVTIPHKNNAVETRLSYAPSYANSTDVSNNKTIHYNGKWYKMGSNFGNLAMELRLSD